MDRVRINIFSEEQRKKMSFPVVPLWKICFFASSRSPTFSCSMKHLTIEQRYKISAYLQSGKSINQTALLVGVHRNTVWREVHSNEDKRNGSYRPELAQKKYNLRMQSRNHYVKFTDNLKVQADILLKKDYSPEQVTGFMRSRGLEMVSHETIYQYVWEDKKHGEKKLYTHLRRRGRHHKKEAR